MVVGLPCVVSPLPSYVELWRKLVSYGEPFIITKDDTTWEIELKSLMLTNTREWIGEYARKCVVEDYNIDTIGKQFVSILEGI